MQKKQYKCGCKGSGINKYLIRVLKNKNIVLNSVRMHNLASLLSKCSQQFQFPNMVSNCVRMRQ